MVRSLHKRKLTVLNGDYLLKSTEFYTCRSYDHYSTIKTIHKELRIDLIDDRANKLFSKFIITRQSHEIIAQEIQDFLLQNSSRNNLKYKAPFDSIINTPNS
ncbi:hypothetical protein BpHYR1_017481 [Brachionus plicatilis]|uniref:Uncharacterized protein n=1 Tax=Brachionus plicatilis TaxID=10195 RepID=A0A3M7QPS6_BRAPC|nr:hypothetical protein BpHYR1_017481 [Brachionus plicatilis]